MRCWLRVDILSFKQAGNFDASDEKVLCQRHSQGFCGRKGMNHYERVTQRELPRCPILKVRARLLKAIKAFFFFAKVVLPMQLLLFTSMLIPATGPVTQRRAVVVAATLCTCVQYLKPKERVTEAAQTLQRQHCQPDVFCLFLRFRRRAHMTNRQTGQTPREPYGPTSTTQLQFSPVDVHILLQIVRRSPHINLFLWHCQPSLPTRKTLRWSTGSRCQYMADL